MQVPPSTTSYKYREGEREGGEWGWGGRETSCIHMYVTQYMQVLGGMQVGLKWPAVTTRL